MNNELTLVDMDFSKTFGVLVITFADRHGNSKTSSIQFKKAMTIDEFKSKINKLLNDIEMKR